MITLPDMRPAIVTREDARKAGLVHYYTGKPCRRDHLAMRYTSTGNCCGCLASRDAPGRDDGRRVPRVVKLRYAPTATAADRKAWGEYLRVCVDAFHTANGRVIVNIEKV